MVRKLAILALAAWPPAATGQTNDHLYRSWRWETTLVAPRPAGLAGAFVAVADDSSAAWLNPAGLATLPKTELGGGFLAAGTGSLGADRLKAWSGLSHASGGGRLSKRFAIGAYLARPRVGRLELSPEPMPPDSTRTEGYLDGEIIDGGVVGAYRALPRLSLGARVTASHLKLEGFYRRLGPTSSLIVESGTAAGQTRVTASLGALYEVTRAVRLGLLIAPGVSYLADRTANDLSGTIDTGSRYEVRAPGIVSMGASVQLGPRLLVASQVDYVRYSEITVFVRPGTTQTTEYAAKDGIEPRLGAELSWPVAGMSLQLRAGVQSQAPGSLRFAGSDPVEAAAFPGSSRRLLGAAGGSVVTRSGLRLDVAAAVGGTRSELLAACRFRF